MLSFSAQRTGSLPFVTVTGLDLSVAKAGKCSVVPKSAAATTVAIDVCLAGSLNADRIDIS